MYNHFLFLSYWLVNASVLFFAGIIPGNNVVLGSWRFNSFEASAYAGFWLTFLVWLCWDFAMARQFKFDKKGITVGFFLIVNVVSVWAISRFYFVTGFELKNYVWALIIGLTATVFQRVAWRIVVTRQH